MLLTIFTPAYNRANLLDRLYKSLCEQEEQNFEWIVVDDGSEDETKQIVASYIAERKIPVTYKFQVNSGKHIAINAGVELAIGELFFIVDSDDILARNATRLIAEKYSMVRDIADIGGLSGRKGYSATAFIGSQEPYDDFIATTLDFRYKRKIKGDMAEVVLTSVLKEFPFPNIAGEKFCTEGLVWFRIASKYKFMWFSEIIYIAEYLNGGLTSNNFRIRKDSPQATTLFYAELSRMPIPIIKRIRATINYWRFAKFLKTSFVSKWDKVPFGLSLIALPISLIFRFKDFS